MRHCQPLGRAIACVRGGTPSLDSQGTASAESHGSQWLQSMIRNAERLPEQQAAKARAVDEEGACDAPLAVELQRGDVAGFTVAFDVDDLAFDAANAALLCVVAQHLREERASKW